ncbi:MAG: lysylphosphatidylglycerol synthase domain-containing protein [Bacteroidales bacterium]|nr:lysylphosphatidylglycerol synthase domain-containing protein [Bacteroidales bacterium]
MRQYFRRYGISILIWIATIVALAALIHRFVIIKTQFELSVIQQVYHDWALIIVLLFMILNWLIEAMKWKVATLHLQRISLVKAIKGVLMGVAVSVIMPNRTGEFLGKILSLEKGNRIKGVFASMLTSIAQLCMTLIFGLIGVLILYWHQQSTVIKYIWISIILLIVFLLVYFFIPKVVRQFYTKIPERYRRFLLFLKNYSISELMNIIGLSLLRYFIFVFQLYLLFICFDIFISPIQFFLHASVCFLLTTIVPTTSLSELIVRSQIGLMIFSSQVNYEEIIVFVFSMLWLINIAIPALIGLFIMVKIRD